MAIHHDMANVETTPAATGAVSRITKGLAVALAIAVVGIILPKLIIADAVTKITVGQGLELGLSLLAIAVLGRGRFADYGFRLPRPDRHWTSALLRWAPVGLAALVVGMLATIAMLVSGAVGNPVVKQLSFPQIILFVWIFSSTIEEIFTRGFLQSYIAAGTNREVNLIFFRIGLPALISAVFFALMHLVLLLSDVDVATIVIILLFTFSVGLLAARQRERSGSLVPAIGVHMLANIGGVIGGIIYTVIRILMGGTPPSM